MEVKSRLELSKVRIYGIIAVLTVTVFALGGAYLGVLADRSSLKLPENLVFEDFSVNVNELINTIAVSGTGRVSTTPNQAILTFGVVTQIQGLADKECKTHELIEDYKTHPYIANLIRGGKTVEYSGDIIHEGGISMVPNLYTNGFLVAGTAGSLVLNNAFTFRGADFAIASGIIAAEAVIKAKEKNSFNEETLSIYRQLLNQSFVLRDMVTFKKIPRALENQRIYTLYPELLCKAFENVFTVDQKPTKKLSKKVKEAMRGKVSTFQLIRDGIKMVRAL